MIIYGPILHLVNKILSIKTFKCRSVNRVFLSGGKTLNTCGRVELVRGISKQLP